MTPKIGGTHLLVLEVRPIVAIEQLGGGPATAPASDAEAAVQQYEMSAHVRVPWSERPQETMSRLAATFEIAEGLVKALTALVVAVIALGTALGIRRHKKKAAAEQSPPRPRATG